VARGAIRRVHARRLFRRCFPDAPPVPSPRLRRRTRAVRSHRVFSRRCRASLRAPPVRSRSSPHPATERTWRAIGSQAGCRPNLRRLPLRMGQSGPSPGRRGPNRARPKGQSRPRRRLARPPATSSPLLLRRVARPRPIRLSRRDSRRGRSAPPRPRPGVRPPVPARRLRRPRPAWCLTPESPSRRYPVGQSMDLAPR
jgi:hypothetical protein